METSTPEHRMLEPEFVLYLPDPFNRIIITSPRFEDAEPILPILNDCQVYPWLGAAHPHELSHALRWLKSVKAKCDIGQEDLRVATTRGIHECPVRILREIVGDEEIYLGDCGIVRWRFEDVMDKQQQQQRIRDNEAKQAGDPTIIWSIGYYLKSSYHGKGIMNAAIGTLISWTMANMNVRHIRTTAMDGNAPSVNVLKQNGFLVEKTLPEFALKAGVRVGLHILDWKASLGAES